MCRAAAPRQTRRKQPLHPNQGPGSRVCRRLPQVGWAQRVLAGSLAPRPLGLRMGHRPLQQAQGQHLPGPGLVLVLGRPVTDRTPWNGGYGQGCHRPFCGGLLLPARVAVNEELVHRLLFRGQLGGYPSVPLGSPSACWTVLSGRGPPGWGRWASPSPDSPEAAPLAGSHVSEPAVFTPHFRCQQKSEEGRATASLL